MSEFQFPVSYRWHQNPDDIITLRSFVDEAKCRDGYAWSISKVEKANLDATTERRPYVPWTQVVAEPDPAHHAPSPTATAIPITPPDECFAVRNTGYGACEATIHRDKNTMNVSIPCGDEALTKRERFAMEIMKSLTTTTHYHYIMDVDCGMSGTASDAVRYADALIAELAKERK